ncbi:MAG TPA: hypothetical protein VF478_06435, partial [Anaerolineae bacterium]
MMEQTVTLILPTSAGTDNGPTTAPNPVEQRPRVVPGIESAQFKTRAGIPYVVIRNPAMNTYLKLEPHEFELLALMDGTRNLPALVIEDFKRFHVLAPMRVANLVNSFQEKHFLIDPLANPASSVKQSQSLPERLVRAFLYTEFPLRTMDARVSRWYHNWGKFFFMRLAVVVMVTLGVLGPILFAVELGRGRYTLFQSASSSIWMLLLYVGLELLVLTIHELGHALAVKHAGRYVIRAGLLLYYGAPAAFVDTTDIWMSPRRMRLLTSFAGPLTGFIIGGICALLAFFLPEGPVGAFCFAWGLLFLINNMMNFNPLLELDGYYLLIDWIEKPMLRARAFAFVRGPLWAKLRRREPLTGEEKFFALFGLASILWSLFSIYIALQFWTLQLQ